MTITRQSASLNFDSDGKTMKKNMLLFPLTKKNSLSCKYQELKG